jgi:hypothetical protein
VDVAEFERRRGDWVSGVDRLAVRWNVGSPIRGLGRKAVTATVRATQRKNAATLDRPVGQADGPLIGDHSHPQGCLWSTRSNPADVPDSACQTPTDLDTPRCESLEIEQGGEWSWKASGQSIAVDSAQTLLCTALPKLWDLTRGSMADAAGPTHCGWDDGGIRYGVRVACPGRSLLAARDFGPSSELPLSIRGRSSPSKHSSCHSLAVLGCLTT